MRLFGLDILRTKAAAPAPTAAAPASDVLNRVGGRGGWWSIFAGIAEPFTGAWQRNEELKFDTAAGNPAFFRCVSVISSDIAKCRPKLVSPDAEGVWGEVDSPAFSPVLTKPNHFQNRIQFYTSWVLSKLLSGNTYVLKVRDGRGVVTALYVLDPSRVTPLVTPNGEVYYGIKRDDLAGVPLDVGAIPASEIIHDRWNTLFHPLVGLSPIYACGLAAMQGVEIQRNAVKFFKNGSRPGGVLTAPGSIDDETAARMKEAWEANYSGDSAGKTAVLGNGLTYEPMAATAADSQLIEQLKFSGQVVCGAFGVPPYMAGIGDAPLNNNVQSLLEIYYSQCLQIHFESIELCLDEGLGLTTPKEGGAVYGVEFDLDDLLRMDSATLIKTLSEGLKGLFTTNEARKKLNLRKVAGGDQVLSQQQNFSLEALAKRDAKDDPFATAGQPADPPAAANDDAEAETRARQLAREAAEALFQTRADAETPAASVENEIPAAAVAPAFQGLLARRLFPAAIAAA